MTRLFKILAALGLAVTIGMGIVNAEQVTKEIRLDKACVLGSQSVPSGNYSISFSSDKDGEITLSKGKNTVARANYTLLNLDRKADNTAFVFTVESDGSYKVSRIELKGSKVALKIQ